MGRVEEAKALIKEREDAKRRLGLSEERTAEREREAQADAQERLYHVADT